jgi:hypothetical protein
VQLGRVHTQAQQRQRRGEHGAAAQHRAHQKLSAEVSCSVRGLPAM